MNAAIQVYAGFALVVIVILAIIALAALANLLQRAVRRLFARLRGPSSVTRAASSSSHERPPALHRRR